MVSKLQELSVASSRVSPTFSFPHKSSLLDLTQASITRQCTAQTHRQKAAFNVKS